MPPTKPAPIDTAKYRRSIGNDDPVRSLKQAPARLRKGIAGLSEKQLATPELPGKWSIRDILAHLADGEIILGSRLRFIAAHDEPAIPGYDQDLFVARLGVGNTSAKKLLESFVHARATTLELLERLPKEAFNRIGLHSERGEESVADLVTMYAGHDRVHDAQIARVRERLEKPARPAARKPAKRR